MTAQIITAWGTAIAAVVGAVFGGIGLLIATKNGRKIDDVHAVANSLSQRASASAKEAGLAQGKQIGRDDLLAQQSEERRT